MVTLSSSFHLIRYVNSSSLTACVTSPSCLYLPKVRQTLVPAPIVLISVGLMVLFVLLTVLLLMVVVFIVVLFDRDCDSDVIQSVQKNVGQREHLASVILTAFSLQIGHTLCTFHVQCIVCC